MSKVHHLYIQETWINATEGHLNDETEVYETRFKTTSALYKNCLKEYGRCTSKIYVDNLNGDGEQVGWVFQKRHKYDDSNESFLQETWVTVHTKKPDVVVTHNYKEFK